MANITIKYDNGTITINTDLLPEWTITGFRYLCKSTLDISHNQTDAAAGMYTALKETAADLEERAERRPLDSRENATLKRVKKMLVTLETKYPDAAGATDETKQDTAKEKEGETMKYVYMENTNANHSKFYEMKQTDDGTFTATWGKIGTPGRETVYPMTKWQKIYREKRRHGYAETEKEKTTMAKKKYFDDCNTLEALRTVYKDLLKVNHPDNGGAVDVMQNINAQYDARFAELKAAAKIETKADAAKWSDIEDEAIRNAIAAIIGYPGLNIEIVGCWVWVDGNTYECKDGLKTAGYKWSRARKKWHFAAYEKKYYKGSKKSFDDLRKMYGSEVVEDDTKKIA